MKKLSFEWQTLKILTYCSLFLKARGFLFSLAFFLSSFLSFDALSSFATIIAFLKFDGFEIFCIEASR